MATDNGFLLTIERSVSDGLAWNDTSGAHPDRDGRR